MSSKFSRSARPESMYGQRRVQSAQSDDSSYGSYHGPGPAITPPTRNASNSSSNYNGGMMLPNYGPGPVAMTQMQSERKASSSSQQQQQQQQQHQQQQQTMGNRTPVSIQNTNLPPPPPQLQNHPGGYPMAHAVRQN